MTADEYYTLLQIGITVLSFLALILAFVYIAYEKG